MTRSRRCARPGCRAWAMRGEEYCRAHQTRYAEPGDATGRFSERIDGLLERLDAAVATERGALGEEISALRLVLARLLAEEDDPGRLATSIPRVVDAVVRAARAQRALSDATAESLTAALTQVLIELGLDEQR